MPFSWNEEFEKDFQDLNDVMCTTLVLALSNFNKTSILECDTLDKGIWVALLQDGCSFAFTSKKLFGRNMGKSTYEKEMLDISYNCGILT
jgi:hypothetical protein